MAAPISGPVSVGYPPSAAAGTASSGAAADPAAGPSAVARLRGQLVAAHRAALEAQHALVERLMQSGDTRAPLPGGRSVGASEVGGTSRSPGTVPAPAAPAAAAPGHVGSPPLGALPPFVSRVTRVSDSGGRTIVGTEYDVPAEQTVDGQVPVAILLSAVVGCRLLTGDRGGGRAPHTTVTFAAELPAAGEPIGCEVSVDTGSGVDLVATCHTPRTAVLQLGTAPAAAIVDGPPRPAAPPGTARFTPLARTATRSLTSADLALLAEGKAADVFGAGYAQNGCNPSLRLPGAGLRVIDRVEDIDRTGGPHRLGALTAATDLGPAAAPFDLEALLVEGALQVLSTYLLYLGAQLVLPDARFQPVPGVPVEVEFSGPPPAAGAALRYQADVFELGFIPRPHALADVTVHADGVPVMTIHGIGVEIREKSGTPYCPGPGGKVGSFLGRTNATGERSQLNEFHMNHAAKGDLAVAMGPEFEIYRDSKAPYIPNGDFLFVDRMMTWTGERGRLVAGATMDTEYDSAADAWYYQHNGYPFMPYCVLMETSLQSAVLLGYYLGATLPFPTEQFRIRNLDGHATVVKDVDLRGRTIRQHSTLLFSSAMPGTILQKFQYDLSVGGEVFYTGESLFGYHTEEALSNQLGLDSGKHVPPWLDGADVAARHIDLRGGARGRLAGGAGLRIGSGQLDLVDAVDIVPGGGLHQAGYLRGHRYVRPDEWDFSCHFHRDPVMPGSLGVEAILQAMQLYVIEFGLAAGIDRPQFAASAGVTMGWRYRGQILRTDSDMDFDVHIKEVRREPGRILVIGDANLWKHGLRIYELTDVAVAVTSGTGSRTRGTLVTTTPTTRRGHGGRSSGR